jgi:cobalt-zinc-cadmium efflux system membrane fusion protein
MTENSIEREEKEETTEVVRAAGERETPEGVRTRVEVEQVAAASHPPGRRSRNNVVIVGVVAVALVSILAMVMWSRSGGTAAESTAVNVNAGTEEHGDEHGAGEGQEVKLSPETLEAAGIEIEGVTQRPAVALLRATGTVEVNQQQSQQATPLVGGRVERVNLGLGDFARAGQVLAVISSPQIAQMHGKLHEAETARALAERNLQRVQRAENRVAVLSAKAKLDEAEATLKRTRRLIELGAGAGKDLIAADAAYKTAKAEFDFQSNISLNRELQEARAAVETTRVDVAHIRDEMRALGVTIGEGEGDHDHSRDTSLVAVIAPVSGTVTERLVNAGAGVEAGKALFTISNLSTVWVIANVPEAQIGQLRTGTPAEVRSAALGDGALSGRVSYIDPQLNEETRTARVRIETTNPGDRLKAGMFVEVGFQTGTGQAAGEELMVKSEAVQRIGDRSVIFMPKDDEPGAFEVRDVQVGGETEGYRRILGGLAIGDRVVTKGSFTLKTQMMKGEMGDHDH